jgi:acyl-CoA synthetase (NDP forming)
MSKQIEQNNHKEQRTVDEINAAINTMAHPRAIAVVGATRTRSGGFPGMFSCIRNFGFPGAMYPINPKADEIDGIKAYPSLSALPEPVDLVVISLPGPLVPNVLKDCIASGNKNIHIFSSGFKETGEPEGMRLNDEIEQIAAQGKLNIVGPNCMGFYVPESRLLTWVKAAEKSGPLSFISQSGGHAQDFTHYSASRLGLYASKVISYGNALTLDSPDFLEYLGQDEKTGIIAMYLEGVKNGRRLMRLAADINRKKPILMMKAGLTESGARTVASHTGSMAGGEKIWNAFFRQTGTIQTDSLEQMAETAMALDYLPRWTGKNVVILGTGGGVGVEAADSCSKTGLHMPALSPDLMKKLREHIPPAGNMIRNPIDAHILLLNLELLGPVLELVSSEAYVDLFIISLHFDWLHDKQGGEHAKRIGAYIAQEARKHTRGKPLAVVWRQYQPTPQNKETRKTVETMLLQARIPVYNGLHRALTALSKTEGYYAFLEKFGSPSHVKR